MNKKVLVLLIGILLIVSAAIIIMTLKDKKNDNIEKDVKVNDVDSNNDNGSGNLSGNERVLVLYFSMSGNTETVANIIHDELKCDILRLETVKSYKSDYNDLLDEAQEEQKKKARPELKTKINIDDYDTIFLGYPNWWGDMPMPIYTFLDDYDLAGKKIAPFITHGGSGLSNTPKKIKDEEQNATVMEGLAISGTNDKNSKSAIKEWLTKIGY